MMKCIVCHTNEATIPDRNNPMSSRKKICSICHSNRLKNDFIDILIIEKKRRKPLEKGNGKEKNNDDFEK